MSTFEIIAAILSSSLLSAGLTGWITWRIKQSEFKKTVFVNFINRRLSAYEELENLIGTLSVIIRDDDGLKYNFIFKDVGMWGIFFKDITAALKFNTWYSTNIIDTLRDINNLQDVIGKLDFETEESINKNIKVGKENYERIRLLKEKLVYQIREDYKTIHITDFNTFFGNTKNQKGKHKNQ